MRVPLQWAGGVNLNADPRAIRDNQVALSKNACPTLEGLLDKREPVLCARNAVYAPAPALPISTFIKPITLGVPDPVTGYDFVLHYQDDVNGGEYLVVSGMDKQAYPFTVPSVRVRDNPAGGLPFGPYQFINYRGRVIAVGGDNEGFFQLVRVGDTWQWVKASFAWPAGIGGVDAAQVQSEAVKPRVACSYRGRMVFANFGPGKGHWLVFADRNSTTHTNNTAAPLWARIGDEVLSENGNHAELESIVGEDIIAMREVALTNVGSQIDTGLLILTSRSAVLCTGQLAQTTDSGFETSDGYLADFAAQRINYEVGIAGVHAICTTPYGTVWASKDEVWLLQGNTPVPIGTNIRPALRACPPSLRQWWSMAYANGIVFLSLVTQQTTDEYRLVTEHWRLDLRQGVPQSAPDARWWGPQDYSMLWQWASADGLGTLCHSLVTKRDTDDLDTVYGIVRAGTETAPGDTWPSLNLITFNRGSGGLDQPFESTPTARTWGADPNTPPGSDVVVGDLVMPSVLKRNGRIYKYVVAGAIGGAEPTWKTDGSQGADGTAEYREVIYAAPMFRLINYGASLVSATIQVDIQFKDLNFGQPAKDKVIRRADMTAYLALKTQVGIRVKSNGGDWMMQLGPCIIGDFTLGRVPAMNDLGLAVLDYSSVAQEYQSRTLRPSLVAGRANTGLGYLAAGVVRGRQLQCQLYDGDGYVIDDSNNKLLVCDYLPGDSLASDIGQATIEKGYYQNANTLMTAIVEALNALTVQLLGTSGDWNYETAFPGPTPYVTTFTKGMTTPRTSSRLAFLFYTTDLVVGGVTYYLSRSKRLLATLGFDTSEAYKDADGALLYIPGSAVPLSFYGECQDPTETVSPTRLYGVEVIPYKKASPLSLSSLELDIHLKEGLPLSTQSR